MSRAAEHSSMLFFPGQEVLDSTGTVLGYVQALYQQYIVVRKKHTIATTFYIPSSLIATTRHSSIIISETEQELRYRELDSLPQELFQQHISRPSKQIRSTVLSPAQTGHYHTGTRSPGINTDASGSYHAYELLPHHETGNEQRHNPSARIVKKTRT